MLTSLQIRRQIYIEAGVPSRSTVDMNKRPISDTSTPHASDNWPPLLLGLIATCHLVHDEVCKVLHSENHFVIKRTAPGGLHPLECLGDKTTRELQFLVIKLNFASCTQTCCKSQLIRGQPVFSMLVIVLAHVPIEYACFVYFQKLKKRYWLRDLYYRQHRKSMWKRPQVWQM